MSDAGTIAFHPLADLFPLIEGAEFADLVADIRAHGQRVPITLIEGQAGPLILDGRNRYRACVEVGVEPRFETFTGDDAAAFVISANLKRRHLSESQRSMVSGKLANLPAHRPAGKSANLRPSLTTKDAAAMLNVSPRSVETARAVIAKGTPELIKRVEKGEVSVSAAAVIAKAPQEAQEAVAALPQEKVRTAAKVLRDDPSLGFAPSPKLLAKIEELEVAEAKAAEVKKSLPSKAEALAISKRDGIWVRANDGKSHFWSDPKDEKRTDVWMWIKPVIAPLVDPKHTPAEVVASLDQFWRHRALGMIDATLTYLNNLKAEVEASNEQSQIAAE
jgi:ParB-like chromosome segregation protein Spo0J